MLTLQVGRQCDLDSEAVIKVFGGSKSYSITWQLPTGQGVTNKCVM